MMTQNEILTGVSFTPSDDEITAVIEAARRDVRYLVTDYPVELLVQKFKEEPEQEGDIYIPEYQRKLRWTDQAQSYFIESVILRIPVPPIFFYDVKGRLEIVDGSQRVRTLARFVNNEFALGELEKLDILSGLDSIKRLRTASRGSRRLRFTFPVSALGAIFHRQRQDEVSRRLS
jgi:hypothetical protein